MAAIGGTTTNSTPFTPEKIAAWGLLLVDLILAQVALALGNINVLGIRPFEFLTQWGIDLQYSASAAYSAAIGAQNTASAATTAQSQQSIAKPGYLAMDATADAVFPISNISGSSPVTIAVTSAASAIGFITTPDNGKKASIIWLGSSTAGLTGFYVNLYQLDVTTGVATLIEAGTNIVTTVSNAMAWNYYDIAPIDSVVGFVYAAEIVVTGTGTYQLAGEPADWKPANTLTIPQTLGAARTTSLTPAPATFTPTYGTAIPWFGLGGFAFAGPLTTSFFTAGTFTYTLPNWLKYGDNIDVIVLGAGGGGQGAVGPLNGSGGLPGSFSTRSFIIGVDIPVSETTFDVIVGAGGLGGYPFINGNPGGDSAVIVECVTETVTVTAAGGAGGYLGYDDGIGYGPGNHVYTGVTYPGGGAVGLNANNALGGGGGGGAFFNGGALGGAGGVWIAAYQAGTIP